MTPDLTFLLLDILERARLRNHLSWSVDCEINKGQIQHLTVLDSIWHEEVDSVSPFHDDWYFGLGIGNLISLSNIIEDTEKLLTSKPNV